MLHLSKNKEVKRLSTWESALYLVIGILIVLIPVLIWGDTK